jgi:hypothetical protein
MRAEDMKEELRRGEGGLTLGELRELVSELEGHPDSLPVFFAHQPNYPFLYSIDCTAHVLEDEEDGEPFAIVLAEDDQLGYLPGDISKQIGWR